MARFRSRRQTADKTGDAQGPSLEARRAVRAAARDLGSDAAWEIEEQPADDAESRRAHPFPRAASTALSDPTREDPALLEARLRAAARAANPPRGLSQTNRGLRMILIAAVAVVIASWAATVGSQYIAYLKIQELSKGDPDALRVMCAVNPPSERDIGMMHLCETAAKAGPAPAKQ